MFQCHRDLAGRGLHVWAGVISNLNTRGVQWLREADPSTWPDGVGVSLHWYPHGSGPAVPHPGFRSRQAEVDALTAIVAGRPWAVTEFGYHTARRRVTRTVWGFEVPVGYATWTDDEVAAHAAYEWQFWEAQGAVAAFWFQLNDGPTDHFEHKFGIRRVDGSWKPVAHTFRRDA